MLGRIAQSIMRVPIFPGALRLARNILRVLPDGIALFRDKWRRDYFVHYQSHVGAALLSQMKSEPAIIEIAKKELRASESSTILDVGANAGTFSLPLNSQADEILLIEADPQLAELLQETVRYNRFDGVRVLNRAITDGNVEKVTFYRADKLKDLSSMREEYVKGRDQYTETKVTASTLEEVIDEAGLKAVGILKIDIEGMTTEAILSLGDRVSDVEIIIAEKDDKVEKAISFLRARGFSVSKPLSERVDVSKHTRNTLIFRNKHNI